MITLNATFKIKILAGSHDEKANVQNADIHGNGGGEYLVVGYDDTRDRFVFVDDGGFFDYVSTYNTKFAGFVDKSEKVANISQIETEVTLSAGVKAEITKQINAKLANGKELKK